MRNHRISSSRLRKPAVRSSCNLLNFATRAASPSAGSSNFCDLQCHKITKMESCLWNERQHPQGYAVISPSFVIPYDIWEQISFCHPKWRTYVLRLLPKKQYLRFHTDLKPLLSWISWFGENKYISVCAHVLINVYIFSFNSSQLFWLATSSGIKLILFIYLFNLKCLQEVKNPKLPIPFNPHKQMAP